jgi:hypothetical protein
MNFGMLAASKKLEILERIVFLVVVDVMNVVSGRDGTALTLPHESVQPKGRFVVSACLAVPHSAAIFDTGVTHTSMPGTRSAIRTNPRPSTHTG